MEKATIEIELGELAKDWEAVAFRVPTRSEWICGIDGCLVRCESDAWTQPRLIVRRKFVWPSWCKAVAICKDSDGRVFAFAKMPVRSDNAWFVDDGQWQRLDPRILDFQLPDDHDWTVPILNPNYKEPSGG